MIYIIIFFSHHFGFYIHAKTTFSVFHEKQQVLFFHIVCITIFSTCSIVPYYNWNFFGLPMVFYMSKIILRHEFSVPTLLLVSLQFLEMVQSFQISRTLLNVALELLNDMLNWMDGSSPNVRLVANVIENSPQSTPFFAAVLV